MDELSHMRMMASDGRLKRRRVRVQASDRTGERQGFGWCQMGVGQGETVEAGGRVDVDERGAASGADAEARGRRLDRPWSAIAVSEAGDRRDAALLPA